MDPLAPRQGREWAPSMTLASAQMVWKRHAFPYADSACRGGERAVSPPGSPTKGLEAGTLLNPERNSMLQSVLWLIDSQRESST